MSENVAMQEVPEQELKFGKLWDLVIEIAKKLKAVPLNQHQGCWYVRLDERWEFAVNAHNAVVRSPELEAEVPPFHLYAKFNGWPFAVISPQGGEIGSGRLANIDTFSEALKKYLETLP